VTRVKDSGSVDLTNRAIRWGPFFGAESRSLTYEAIPADATGGPLGLVGVGSFDGRSILTGGTTQLGEGCRLALEAAAASHQLRLTIQARTRALFLVERSDDLRLWTPVTEVKQAAESMVIMDSLERDVCCRFYRARQVD